MTKLMTAARKFVAAEEGATMVEYGLMVALISAFLIVTIQLLGTNLQTQFNNVATAIGNA